MFKLDDFFKSCDIFSEILIKRFEENFDSTTSQIWITPGHIAFSKSDSKLITCDARPYDFSTSPSEPESSELLTAASKILEVLFDTESPSTRMFVLLGNGDVQIFEYRTQLYEWARIGYFNVNIVSPNTNSNHVEVTKALISCHQNMVYWAQKEHTSDTSLDLFKRSIPLSGVREITQSAVGVPQKLLKNCPHFDLVEIRDSICVFPHLPNSVNLYVIISARLHVWLFHIDGKLLWRGVIGDTAIDFITLCTRSLGLWSQTGAAKVCKVLSASKNHAYVLHNADLLRISANGEVSSKVRLSIDAADVIQSLVMQNVICSFTRNFESLQVHSILTGHLIQSFNLTEMSPVTGTWSCPSAIPTIGFYSEKRIFKMNYQSLSSVLLSEHPCDLQSSNLLKMEQLHVLALLEDAQHHEFNSCDVPPLKGMPKGLQSEALMLAIMQSCREKGFSSRGFPLEKPEEILRKRGDLPETKLNEMLRPIVESFQQLEKYRNPENHPDTKQ